MASRASAAAPRAAGGLADGEGLLVAVEHFGGDVRPGEALGALARRDSHARTAGGSSASRRRASARASASPGGDELPVATVADDVAVAGDVRGDDGRGGGERLGQDHAEALAVQRGRAQHVGARELCELALLGDLAERAHAAVVEHHVGDLLGAGADERERRRNVLAQRLERPQQDRQALAFDGLADEQDPQRSARVGAGRPAVPAGGRALTERRLAAPGDSSPADRAGRGMHRGGRRWG